MEEFKGFLLSIITICTVVITINSCNISRAIRNDNNQQNTSVKNTVSVTGSNNDVKTVSIDNSINNDTNNTETSLFSNNNNKPDYNYTYSDNSANYVVYKKYLTLSDDKMKELNPYVKDYDLIDYGCPNCGYQLYCIDSAGTAASARLKCTLCSWESKEVYIKHCDDSRTARYILLDLYTEGMLTKDMWFEYPKDAEMMVAK